LRFADSDWRLQVGRPAELRRGDPSLPHPADAHRAPLSPYRKYVFWKCHNLARRRYGLKRCGEPAIGRPDDRGPTSVNSDPPMLRFLIDPGISAADLRCRAALGLGAFVVANISTKRAVSTLQDTRKGAPCQFLFATNVRCSTSQTMSEDRRYSVTII
jgi:hypothetical protein